MHTIIRNSEAPISTKTVFHTGAKGNKAPRFDKIEYAAKYANPRSKSTLSNHHDRDKSFRTLDVHSELAALLKGKAVLSNIFPSIVDTK